MSFNDDKSSARLDKIAARLTGNQVQLGFTGPFMVIIANAILLLATVAGIIGSAQGLEFGHPLLLVAMLGSVFYNAALKLKERGDAPLDERERAIRWKSVAIGAGASSTLVGMWALLLESFADNGMWYPQTGNQWSSVGLFIIGLMMQIANISEAWMTPGYAPELDPND